MLFFIFVLCCEVGAVLKEEGVADLLGQDSMVPWFSTLVSRGIDS